MRKNKLNDLLVYLKVSRFFFSFILTYVTRDSLVRNMHICLTLWRSLLLMFLLKQRRKY